MFLTQSLTSTSRSMLKVTVVGLVLAYAGMAHSQESGLRLNVPTRATVWDASISEGWQNEAGKSRLAVSSADGAVVLWNLERFNEPPRLFMPPPREKNGLEEPVRSRGVALSADGSQLAFSTPRLRNRINSARLFVSSEGEPSSQEWREFTMPVSANTLTFSRDGRYLAAALRDGYGVRVFDLQTETWIAEQNPPTAQRRQSSVIDVVFMNDGRTLIAAAEGGGSAADENIIYVLQIQSEDETSFLERKSQISPPTIENTKIVPRPRSLSLHPDGRRLAVAYANQGQKPLPTDSQLDPKEAPAVPRTPPRIDIFQMKGYELEAEPVPVIAAFQQPGWTMPESLLSVAWSRSGRYLYAAGYFFAESNLSENQEFSLIPSFAYEDRIWRNSVLRWKDSYWSEPDTYLPAGLDTVMALVPFGEDGIVYASQDPIVGAFDGNGTIAKAATGAMILELPRSLELRTQREFSVSRDARVVRFCAFPRDAGRRVTFDYSGSSPALTSEAEGCQPTKPDSKDEFDHIVTQDPDIKTIAGWAISDLYFGSRYEEILQRNKQLRTPLGLMLDLNFDDPRVLTDINRAIDPVSLEDGLANAMLVGSSNFLRVFSSDGSIWNGKAELELVHEALRVNSIKAQGDGYVFVVAHSDGVIRWYRWNEGAIPDPFLSLYVVREPNGDSHRWIIWTSSGLYDSNGGGITDALSLVRSEDTGKPLGPQETALDLAESLYCPGAVRRVLELQDEAAGTADYAASMHDEEPACGLLHKMKDAGAEITPMAIKQWTQDVARSLVKIRVSAHQVTLDLLHLEVRVDDPEGKVDQLRLKSGGSVYEWSSDDLTSDDPLVVRHELSPKEQCKGATVRFATRAMGRGMSLTNHRSTFEILEGPNCEKPKRELWSLVLANDYTNSVNPGVRLRGAVADAKAFIQFLCAQTKHGFWASARVTAMGPEISQTQDLHCLDQADQGPKTVDFELRLKQQFEIHNVRGSLAALTREIATADPDTEKYLYVFLAGHGGGGTQRSKKGLFYYLLDPDIHGPDSEYQKYLSFVDIASSIAENLDDGSSVRTFMFVDACRRDFDSFGAEVRTLPAFRLVDAIVTRSALSLDGLYLATQPNGLSKECKIGSTHRGAFSVALLDGLQKPPPVDSTQYEVPPDLNSLHPDELGNYLQSAVPKHCCPACNPNERQYPDSYVPPQETTATLAVFD